MGSFGVNMSYCRFENTSKALEECLEDMYEIGIEKLEEDANRYERPHIRGLIELCKQVCEDFEHQIEDEQPPSPTWTQEEIDASNSGSKGSKGWDEIDRFGRDMENLPF